MVGCSIFQAFLLVFLLLLRGAYVGAQYRNCSSSITARIQDGVCDDENNNYECFYDGGDCCTCTVENYLEHNYEENHFFCRDPNSGCVDPLVSMYPNCTRGDILNIGDGYCDMTNNNEGCFYDGGDCCQCTNIGNSSFSISETLCVDLKEPCLNPDAVNLQQSCPNGSIDGIQDSWCDIENNNQGCLYDGGDCCPCTCVSGRNSCGINGFICLDPQVADLQAYTCEESPPTPIPCVAGLQREWIVENTTQARAMANAVRCSGGFFNIIFKGNVVVDTTISIIDGTVLNVTSIDADAVIDGVGETRLFSVVNASLHLCNITLRNGKAIYGGAIAASHSTIHFDSVKLLGNTASTGGGAVFLSNGSLMSFDGETLFYNNTAFDGGAFYATSGSNASWKGDTTFSNNIATSGDGGALYLTHGSSAVWTATSRFLANFAGDNGGALNVMQGSITSWVDESMFSNNAAHSGVGGALCLTDGSRAVWTASSHFLNNTAAYNGGAFFLKNDSSVFWTEASQFVENHAGNNGGALYVWDGSNANWTAESHFNANTAGDDGGALYVTQGSNTSWAGESTFTENIANSSVGGALYVSIGSTAIWTAESHFLNNSAAYNGGVFFVKDSSVVWTATSQFVANHAGNDGGALYVWEGSNAAWMAESHFNANTAGDDGGALYVIQNSSTSWAGESTFTENIAHSSVGGALYVSIGSTAIWTAESEFLNNRAAYNGGVFFVKKDSNVIWTATSQFSANHAGKDGGVLYLWDGSNATWTAESRFNGNIAVGDGGALLVVDDSIASWTAESYFDANTAEGDGGALAIVMQSAATWTAPSKFFGNSAKFDGGAVYAAFEVVLSWNNGDTVFEGNSARKGGALFVTNGVYAQWSGETKFTFNSVRLDGGAVGSSALDSDILESVEGAVITVTDKISDIVFNGPTHFLDNVCRANGGAMALVQSLTVTFGTDNTTFVRNSAGLSGGAVFISGTEIGTVFTNVTFVENNAQAGGGVHVTSSGTAITINNGSPVDNPVTFENCHFVDNEAFATGGAVDSASGKDVFKRTSFTGNQARLGGALRLSGTASVTRCFFIDNVSEDDGGPAISNNGNILDLTNNSFVHNVLDCKKQAFLDFNTSGNPFKTICNGCLRSCLGCYVEEAKGDPMCTSLSEAGIEHATSEGGSTTVEGLRIQKGYWRATNTSRNIYKCFNTKACAGGLTGSPNYCTRGYEGPYCSICSKGYVASLSLTCRRCPDQMVNISIVAVITLLGIAVGLAIISYLLSTEGGNAGQGIMDRISRRLSTHSMKNVIVMWQILTQFASVTNVTFPTVYQRFLDSVDIFNFDLSWIVTTGCFFDVDFHDRLLLTTIAPFVALILLGVTYFIAVRRSREFSEDAVQNVRHKHMSMALLVTFLVYSSVSSVVFQMFACDDLDDGTNYLRVDYTIDCDSTKHRVLQIYAGLMIMLYPVGIPALYACILFRNSNILRDKSRREESSVVRTVSSLWKPYKPRRFYYEIVECGRRFLLAGVVVFIYPNSAAQIAAAFAISTVFVFVSEGMKPYESPWDFWISRFGHIIIFSSMYLGFLMKVDVSGDKSSSQKAFEVLLVAAHGCIILAVVVQAVAMVLSTTERQQEDPRPRLRRSSNLTWVTQSSNSEDKINLCLVELSNIELESSRL